jgi:hypothetical protein
MKWTIEMYFRYCSFYARDSTVVYYLQFCITMFLSVLPDLRATVIKDEIKHFLAMQNIISRNQHTFRQKRI